ncbi:MULTISPECIES: ScbR family autoregulator-binding transcription factor [unclassified Streptomyces]|uniref:ScbR family autoregulator-binding transcription factor n=1 Tax=unclassified Streptomyces TaxID=2593676 RepID=UPI002DDB0650|nr:ScbR family autoregulator-binding transcription factor [Streptomyces sp. NBC_01294]WRZ62236.1 TetR family transcriptional regulator [Streptomyces sp. NBC_01294]
MTPKQERAFRTRTQLVLSAAEAFDRQGFAVASLTAISNSAGVSNGALHFHFESKEALAAAVEAEAAERMRTIVDGAARKGASALQALVDTSHAIMLRLRQDVVVRAGFRLSGDAARQATHDLPEQWRQSVVRLLARAGRDGSLTSAVTPSDVAGVVTATVLGFGVLARFDSAWLASGPLCGFWKLMLPLIAAGPVERGELDCEPAVPADARRATAV